MGTAGEEEKKVKARPQSAKILTLNFQLSDIQNKPKVILVSTGFLFMKND